MTQANGINDAGQIVGLFVDATGTHGFLATPAPEPASSITLATCLVTVFAIVFRCKRASNGDRPPA